MISVSSVWSEADPRGSKEVTLWDAVVLGDTRIPRQLVFDLGP